MSPDELLDSLRETANNIATAAMTNEEKTVMIKLLLSFLADIPIKDDEQHI